MRDWKPHFITENTNVIEIQEQARGTILPDTQDKLSIRRFAEPKGGRRTCDCACKAIIPFLPRLESVPVGTLVIALLKE